MRLNNEKLLIALIQYSICIQKCRKVKWRIFFFSIYVKTFVVEAQQAIQKNLKFFSR